MTHALTSDTPPAPSIDMLVSAEKARTIQSYVPWMMNGYVICAWFACWMLHQEHRTLSEGLWLGTLTLLSLANVLAGMLGKRRSPRPEMAQRRLRAVTKASFLFGMLWAVGVLLLWPAQRQDLQLFLIVLTVGLLSGALLSISVHLPAFYAYFLPGVGSLLIATLREGDTVSNLIAIATLTYLSASVRFVKTLSETFVSLMRSRFEVADLARSLQEQKELAEQAREVAEAANRSKGLFLATASHDLRQPVHSLSLFAGALAAQPLSSEGARLVAHLQNTVESLGTMFDALLDISKLDAKTVQPEWRQVNLQHLLENICSAERVVAQEKGLALRLNARPLWVRTDASLLDRVIRNLVANAVRYTDSGGILITARQRKGQAVVRIWDTGQGIPAGQHSMIFDEFVQLHNPERDRNNGLGLGLAIVRRLTALLNISIDLKSRVGKGSVFTLALGEIQAAPVAHATLADRFSGQPAPHRLYSGAPCEEDTNAKRLVIVIDDDIAIREGTAALLHSWGFEVITVGGRAELQGLMATQAKVPHMAICDLRLRHGEEGIETIEYLRTLYNEDLPAILITGDTHSERLQIAQKSGLALLHKPVAPSDLKDAMKKVMLNVSP